MSNDRITTDPGKMGGEPCIRGQRITARAIATLLARGCDDAEILFLYPTLEAADLDAVRDWASNLDPIEERRRARSRSASQRRGSARSARLWRYAIVAQREAAALSALARRALGIEP